MIQQVTRTALSAALSVAVFSSAIAQIPGEYSVNGTAAEVNTTLAVTGDGFALTMGDLAYESDSQRNALTVFGGGSLALKNGAVVTVQNANNLTAFLRVGYGTAGSLTIEDGASLSVGSATRYANFLIGQGIGAVGTVTQTGGTVTSIGSFNLGVNGGSGTYTISDGSLAFDTAGVGAVNRTSLISIGFNNSISGTSTGVFNINGGLVELKPVTDDASVSFIIGNAAKNALQAYSGTAINDSNAGAGNGTVNQTAGTFRVGAGTSLFLSAYGNGVYNLTGGTLEIGGSSLQAQYGNHAQYTYDFNLGAATIKVIGSNLATSVNADLLAGKTVIDTNGLDATWAGNLTAAGLHQVDFGGNSLEKRGVGTLTLSGGSRILDTFVVTGGTAKQTAGDTAAVEFMAGSGSGNTGAFQLDAGTITIKESTRVDNVTTVAGSFRVGDWGGTGTFTQNGGTLTVEDNGAFNIGNQGGTGVYNLNGGTINLNDGLHILGRSEAGKPASSGTLNITGGTLNVQNTGSLIVGNNITTGSTASSGRINQSGGTLHVENTASFWLSAIGPGSYYLTGGTLEIGGNSFQSKYPNTVSLTPNFYFGGGVIKVIGSDLTTNVNAELTGGKISTIDTNGLNATWSGNLTAAGLRQIDFGGNLFAKAGLGTLTFAGSNATRTLDTFAVVAGSVNQTAGATSSVEFMVGTGAGSTAAYTMNGGSITINGSVAANGVTPVSGSFRVGDWGGTGTFTQNGGTLTMAEGGAFNIGNQGGTGVYNLVGGTINLNSGIHILGRSQVGKPASDGTLNISGGTLNIANGGSLIVGNNLNDGPTDSKGKIVQTGGLLHVENDSSLWITAYGPGSYSLLGGTLEIGGTSFRPKYNGGTSTGAFNFGGGTIKVIGTSLTSAVNTTLVANTRSFINTNNLGARWTGTFDGAQADLVKTGAGTLTLAGNVTRTIGYFNTDEGLTVHEAGTTTTTEFVVGSNYAVKDGEFTLSGGTLNVAGSIPSSPAPSFRVGDWGGSGVFNQTGGTLNATGATNIGNRGGEGIYNLSGGTLNIGEGAAPGTGALALGRGRIADGVAESRGTFNATGGTLHLFAGSPLMIGGDTYSVADNANSYGEFNQSGTAQVIVDSLITIGANGHGVYNLNGGTLSIGGTNAIQQGLGTAEFNLGGGTLKVINSNLSSSVLAHLVTGTTSTINTNGFNATFANGFQGDGALNKIGTGALAFNGASQLKAATSVFGVLQVGSAGSGTLELDSQLTVNVTNSVGRLQVGVNGGSGIVNLDTVGGGFTVNDATATTGWGSLDVGRGAGSTGVFNQSTGTVNVSKGALQIGYTGGNGTYSLSGDGVVTLAAASSTFIGSGTNARGALTIADNATFTSDGQVFVGGGAGAIGSITQTGANSLVTFTGTTAWFGANTDETTTAGKGVYTLTDGTLVFNGVSSGVRFGADATGGEGEFTQSGGVAKFISTTLTIGANGTYNLDGGSVEIGGANLNGSGAVKIGNGTIKVTGSALTTGAAVTLKAGKTAVIDTAALGATFSGSITGSGGLQKLGASTLRFTGNSSYTGVTSIDAGTFRVDGVLSGSEVRIANGATLSGHGSVADARILSGGKFILGAAPGGFTVSGDLHLEAGSYTLLQIASATYDSITVGGTLHAGGTLEITFSGGFNAVDGSSFTVFNAGAFSGSFNNVILATLTEGLEWKTSNLYTSGVLSVNAIEVSSPVPEPSTWALLFGGAALALAYAKRRRRQ